MKKVEDDTHLQFNMDQVLKDMEALLYEFDKKWVKMETFKEFKAILIENNLLEDDDDDVNMEKDEKKQDEDGKYGNLEDMEWIETLCGLH